MPGDEEKGLGDVVPRKSGGRKAIYLLVGTAVVIAVLGITLFGGGGDKANGSPDGTNPNIPVTIPQLKSSIDSLDTKVNDFSSQLANLTAQIVGLTAPTVTQAHIDNLQASIDSMTTKLTELDVIVEDLINGTGTGSNVTEYWGEISRWDFDSLRVLGCTDDYTFEVVSKSPSRIEDEDLYEITVEITNTDTTTGYFDNITNTTVITHNATTIALNHELEIVISPRDYCMVDDELMYLDSDSYPYLNWDSEFVTRVREGQEVCRRITFTSEKYDFGALLPGDSLELDLVLELYYA